MENFQEVEASQATTFTNKKKKNVKQPRPEPIKWKP